MLVAYSGCIAQIKHFLFLMLPVIAFGQQTSNQEANAQNATTYNDRD
jgi:hypothetical protein